MVKIPPQLKGCELILLRNGDKTGDPEDFKKPAHKWKEENGGHRYIATKNHLSKFIVPHLKKGGGYAVYCANGMTVIDCDTQELDDMVNEQLPDTFTVKTGSKKHHYYFKTNLENKIILYKPAENEGEHNHHMGEIQAGKKAYVVGPGSKHPNGERYKIEKDLPIAEIDKEIIEDFIKNNGLETRKVRPRTKEQVFKETQKQRKQRSRDSEYFNISLGEVGGMPLNEVRSGVGTHPVHGSDGGENYHVNGDSWFCFRCQTGGGPLEFIAMNEGLIECNEVDPDYPNCMDDDTFVETIIAANKKYGIKGKIPSRAIKTVAIREGFCKPEDIENGWKIPMPAFKKTINWFKDKGVEIPGVSLPQIWCNILGIEGELEVSQLKEMFKDVNPIKNHKVAKELMKETSYATIKETATTRGTGEMYYYHRGVYYPHADKQIRGRTEELMRELSNILEQYNINLVWNTNRINEIRGHIERSTYVSFHDFDSDPFLLNVKNGLLDLRTGELKPHTPEYLSMKQLQVSYNPDLDCPNIDKFFSEIVEPENKEILYEIPASCLGDTLKYQKSFMLVGSGRNGKTKYLELIKQFIGTEFVSSVTLQDLTNHRFKPAELVGKFANICGDLPKNPLRYTGVFKMLTGGDYIEVEKKNQNPINFQNRARLIFAANEMPEVNDQTYAFWRRWIVIKFPYKFEGEKDDPNILDKLTTEEELSGLLTKVVKKFGEIEERGYLTETDSVEKTMEEWKQNSDPLYCFCQKCLEEIPGSYVTKDEMVNSFNVFARAEGFETTTKGRLARELQRYVNVSSDTQLIAKKTHRVWRGVKLSDYYYSNYTSGKPKQDVDTDSKGDVTKYSNSEPVNYQYTKIIDKCDICGQVYENVELLMVTFNDESRRYIHPTCLFETWPEIMKKLEGGE